MKVWFLTVLLVQMCIEIKNCNVLGPYSFSSTCLSPIKIYGSFSV